MLKLFYNLNVSNFSELNKKLKKIQVDYNKAAFSYLKRLYCNQLIEILDGIANNNTANLINTMLLDDIPLLSQFNDALRNLILRSSVNNKTNTLETVDIFDFKLILVVKLNSDSCSCITYGNNFSYLLNDYGFTPQNDYVIGKSDDVDLVYNVSANFINQISLILPRTAMLNLNDNLPSEYRNLNLKSTITEIKMQLGGS